MREDDTDDEEGLGGGSEKRWHPHGLPSDDEDYEACTRDRETAKLSPSSRAALPQLRVEDIPRIMQDTGPLAFEMLQLTFPPQAVELVRDMVGVGVTKAAVDGARECQRSCARRLGYCRTGVFTVATHAERKLVPLLTDGDVPMPSLGLQHPTPPSIPEPGHQ